MPMTTAYRLSCMGRNLLREVMRFWTPLSWKSGKLAAFGRKPGNSPGLGQSSNCIQLGPLCLQAETQPCQQQHSVHRRHLRSSRAGALSGVCVCVCVCVRLSHLRSTKWPYYLFRAFQRVCCIQRQNGFLLSQSALRGSCSHFLYESYIYLAHLQGRPQLSYMEFVLRTHGVHVLQWYFLHG